jgi:hypothetical protein
MNIAFINSGFGNASVVNDKTKLVISTSFTARSGYLSGTGSGGKKQGQGQGTNNQGSKHKNDI